MVKFSNTPPPDHIYKKAQELWDVDFYRGVVFTHDNTIYSMSSLSQDVALHEMVHIRQQEKMGADEWWKEYFINDTFRHEQELEAYQEQYKFICTYVKDRNKQTKVLWGLGSMFCGDMYGKVITHSEAMLQIKNEKNNNKKT